MLGGIMKRTFYFWLLLGMFWFINNGEVQGQEKPQLLLSAATQENHRMNMNDKKNAEGFQHVHALAMDGAGKAIFLGTHVGLFRSEDNGHSWKKLALSTKQSNHDVMAITPDPVELKTIYIATHEAGVFKSSDGGMTWKEINTGIGGPDVHGLAIDPNTPSKLHAAVRDKGEGIYRTTDGGRKWTRVDDGPEGEVKILKSVNIPTGMGGIFLYAGTSTGLQRSPDCF
jgi:photosystem II stability/assembly factor-like uncharacterized protein